MLPRTLKNYNLFVNGIGYAGKVVEATMPVIKIKTEEHRAGGMDAPVELDMGMEKLEGKFVLEDYDPATAKLLGGLTADTPFTFRGAIQAQGETAAQAVAIKITGFVKSRDLGSPKPGDKAPISFEFAARTYQETINGEVVIDIDVVNMKRVIGGVDQLASIRAAIGM